MNPAPMLGDGAPAPNNEMPPRPTTTSPHEAKCKTDGACPPGNRWRRRARKHGQYRLLNGGRTRLVPRVTLPCLSKRCLASRKGGLGNKKNNAMAGRWPFQMTAAAFPGILSEAERMSMELHMYSVNRAFQAPANVQAGTVSRRMRMSSWQPRGQTTGPKALLLKHFRP